MGGQRVIINNLARKIGSILTCLTLIFWVTAQEIALSIHSQRGQQIHTVHEGTPFSVRVTIKGATSLVEEPIIEGLSQVAVQGRSSGSQRIQGPSGLFQEVYLSYTVIADHVGSLTLGPARLGTAVSNQVTIDVLQEQSDQHDYLQPHVQLELDRSTCYVGEKVSFTGRFIWEDPAISSPSFEAPDDKDIKIVSFKKVRQYTQSHDGKDQHIVECTGEFYPLSSGTRPVGPLRVSYRLSSLLDDDIFGSFFSRPQKRVARSEVVELEVEPLPPTDKQVQAVGTFTDFTAALNNTSIPQHEAVTLVLQLTGDTNFSDLSVPTLTLPPSLRSYESKTVPQRGAISWVYIVQGLQKGAHTIPSQEFVYFDTSTHTYKTLATQPLTLTVMPSITQPVPPPKIEEKPDGTPENESPPVARHTTWPVLPVWIFILLLVLPPVVSGGQYLFTWLFAYCRKALHARRSRSAFLRAEHELASINTPAELYPLLKKAFAEYYDMPHATEKELLVRVQKTTSDELMQEVKSVLYDASKVSTYAHESYQDASLITRAQDLLKRLGTVLVLLIISEPLHATTLTDQAITLGGILPFIVWQIGVIVCWWTVWFGYTRFSAEGRFLVVGSLLLCFAGWVLSARDVYRPRAQVRQQTVLRVGPGTDYPQRAAIDEHDELILVKKRGPWYYVSSRKGIGWVPQELLV